MWTERQHHQGYISFPSSSSVSPYLFFYMYIYIYILCVCCCVCVRVSHSMQHIVTRASLQVWNKKSLECTRSLKGHTGSVLCLQFSDDMIISGSSDATVRYSSFAFSTPPLLFFLFFFRFPFPISSFFPSLIPLLPLASSIPLLHFLALASFEYQQSSCLLRRVWSISTGEITNILIHHSEAVLHLRYSEDAIMVTCSKVLLHI